MKKILLIAMTTLAASSSFGFFGDDDAYNCSNGRVNVSTYRHINEKTLRLMAHYMVDDVGTLYSLVNLKESGNQKTFLGATSNGRRVKLVVTENDPITAVLKIENLAVESELNCSRAGSFFGR